MKQYLIDANLPYYFSLWNNSSCIHVYDLGDNWTDASIWDYAKEKNLTIISKDSDFSEKIIFANPPPRVIHIRFGNLKMKDFHQLISLNWDAICKLSSSAKLVNVYRDRIEAIE